MTLQSSSQAVTWYYQSNQLLNKVKVMCLAQEHVQANLRPIFTLPPNAECQARKL